MDESRREIASALLCFLGCVVLVPSSFLLMRGSTVIDLAVSGFIFACSSLTIAAVFSSYAAYLKLGSATDKAAFDMALQAVYTTLYILFGAALFLIGSVMYLSHWAAYHVLGTTLPSLGTWVFRFGSIAYLGGNYRSVCDLVKSTKQNGFWRREDMIVAAAIATFMLGALLYIAGGVVGQMKIGDPLLMGGLWFVGSCCFAAGMWNTPYRRTEAVRAVRH